MTEILQFIKNNISWADEMDEQLKGHSGRRELIPQSCLLTSTQAHTLACIQPNTHNNDKNKIVYQTMKQIVMKSLKTIKSSFALAQ